MPIGSQRQIYVDRGSESVHEMLINSIVNEQQGLHASKEERSMGKLQCLDLMNRASPSKASHEPHPSIDRGHKAMRWNP